MYIVFDLDTLSKILNDIVDCYGMGRLQWGLRAQPPEARAFVNQKMEAK